MSSEEAAGPLPLTAKEELGVYLLLKEREEALDAALLRLLDRIERRLFNRFTVEEFKNLPDIYNDII